MKFEIVNHSYRYPRLLAWQLSSLAKTKTQHRLTYTIFLEKDDEESADVVAFYEPHMPKNVEVVKWYQILPWLRNRAIGRNQAARNNEADWVWFADTDYLFTGSVWDDLAAGIEKNPTARFIRPRTIYETDWPTGDAMIQQMDTLAVRPFNPIGQPRKRMPFALGGVQIIHGPSLRRYGYCEHMTGTGTAEWDFRSDVIVRQMREYRPSIEIPLHWATRIRHSKRGYGKDPQRHQVRN